MLAQLSELERRWRVFDTPEQSDRAELLMGDVSRDIVRDFPTVPARMAADAGFTADVARIVCAVVRRVMEPELTGRAGVEQESEQRGPFVVSRRYSTAGGDDFDLSDREVRILEGPAATAEATQPRWTGDLYYAGAGLVDPPRWPRDENRPW